MPKLPYNVEVDEEVELIIRLLIGALSFGGPVEPEKIEWPNNKITMTHYAERATFIRNGLKARGWTSP